MTVAEANKIYESEFANDEPVFFCGLPIYPIQMKDFYLFQELSWILDINKNDQSDPKIISMQYLDFIIKYGKIPNKQNDKKATVIYLYSLLMQIVLRKNSIDFRIIFDNKKRPAVVIDGNEINRKNFDILRKIILAQNLPDYDDTFITQDLKKDIERANKIKNNGAKLISLEKRKAALQIIQGLSISEINNMQIRRFNIQEDMANTILHYKIMKTASMSGFVEFKQPITHYLYEPEEDIMSSMMDSDALKNKINGI